MKRTFSLLLVIGLTVVVSVSAHADIEYTLTDLGTFGGSSVVSKAFGINQSGQVVGYSDAPTSGSAYYAFRTEPNQPLNFATDNLGTFGGSQSVGYGINNSGQVVGYAYNSGNVAQHAFLYSGSGPKQDLSPLGGGNSIAYGINDSGQIVGDFGNQAFRTEPNQPINLATDLLITTFNGWGQASGINDSGEVVGTFTISYVQTWHAYRTAPNQSINLATDDLGTLGTLSGLQSYGTGINSSGQVVGYAQTNTGDWHAFLHSGNGPINPATDDLGTLGGTYSQANGINVKGQVVGYSYPSGDNAPEHAFVYNGSGAIQDLNNLVDPTSASGWTLTDANAINDLGQIVGYGYVVGNGGERAFLLTPIPEPSSISLLFLAFISLIAFTRRRRPA